MTGSRRSAGWALAFLTVLLPVVGRAATVRAEVQPSRIRADGTVLFKVIVEADALDGVTAPPVGNLKDWSVVNGPSISTQFTYINGRSISSRTFSWVLAPVGPGKRILPALPVEVAGRRLLTDPLEVEVQPAVGTPSPMIQGTPSLPGRGGHPESGSPDVFVRAVVSDAGPFVGQRVELSYLLYTRVEVASIPQLQDVPAYPDFWTEDVATPPHVTARVERVNGVEYRVYTIRTVALFPTSSGTVTLQPATFSVPVKSRGRSGFRRSFFFEPVETVYCRTLPLTLHVRPLPAEGRPANFSNAVGDFNLKVDVDRKEGRTGEALALTATVSGTGNLRSVDPPMVEPTGEFTVYPPRQEDAEASSGEASRTSRKWEYVMVPRRPGSQELPTLRFSYFDPEAEIFKTLKSLRRTVQVDGQALQEAEGESPVQRQEIRRMGSDIHYIRTPSLLRPLPGPPLYRTGWFWLFLAVPPLANMSGLLLLWQNRRSRAMLSVSRRKRARRNALKRLRRAESGVGSRDGQDFYRLLAQALTGFVADKFGSQAAGLTYDRIAGLLAEHAVPESVSRSFLAVLEECDCARFAPGSGDLPARDAFVERARQAVDQLEGHL